MKETSKRIIDLIGVTKEYTLDSTVHRVLDNISFFIRENEFVTLLGPSGCGKTTLLRLIAGFDTLTSGDILFNGESIIDVPPYLRQVNTVFQRYALFPHLDVFDNVAFGLKIRKLPKNKIEKKVYDMLRLVGLSGFERRPISKLSGGQQQRVAIARALVCEPSVLLLDEPLGALDLKFRQEMQLELKRMQKSLGITFVYVTHDQEEALTMSDTVVVMDTGVVQQIGTPEDVYNEPVNSFVADFIGESNITDAVMINDYHVRFAGREFECLDAGFGQNVPVKVVVRPEDILITKNYRPEDVIGTVESILFMGVHYAIRVRGQNGFEWLVHTIDQYETGDIVGFNLEPNDIHVMRISKYDKAGDT